VTVSEWSMSNHHLCYSSWHCDEDKAYMPLRGRKMQQFILVFMPLPVVSRRRRQSVFGLSACDCIRKVAIMILYTPRVAILPDLQLRCSSGQRWTR